MKQTQIGTSIHWNILELSKLANMQIAPSYPKSFGNTTKLIKRKKIKIVGEEMDKSLTLQSVRNRRRWQKSWENVKENLTRTFTCNAKVVNNA